MQTTSDNLCVAELKSAYGIKGWLWLYAYTDPMQAVFEYQPLFYLQAGTSKTVEIQQWRKQGKGLVVKLAGVDDRNAAESLVNTKLWLKKSDLPVLVDDEYYWSDLVGLSVMTQEQVLLGEVKQLFETNAHQIMEVQPTPQSIDTETRLIPWHKSTVVSVDLNKAQVLVDWQPDY